MRTITDHIVEGDSANHQLTITVVDDPGAGGANHRYDITGADFTLNPVTRLPLSDRPAMHVVFQNGPIKEFGVNGATRGDPGSATRDCDRPPA